MKGIGTNSTSLHQQFISHPMYCVCMTSDAYGDNLQCILYLIDFGNCPCPSGVFEGNPFKWHLMYILASSVLV